MSEMHPNITIVCAFTRLWAIDRWIDCLGDAVHDPERTSLVFTVDADEPHIKWLLTEYAKSHPYKSVDIIMNEHNAPSEVNLARRRQRIAEVKNQSKPLVATTDCEYVIGLEDDTVFERDHLMKLLEPFANNPRTGFVEGVQCGRHGVKIIGAWNVTPVVDPIKAETLLPKDEGLESITAGGFYGYATPKELYIAHDYFSGSSQPYGPDVNYGVWLKMNGYRNFIDWSIVFGHNNHDNIITPDERVATVHFEKNPATGHWDRKDIQK